METNNYEVSVKKWGWTTMSFTKFLRKYDTMAERVKIISNPKKCSVSHIYENRELTLVETIALFAKYDYSICEKNYYDLEQYLVTYQQFDNESIQQATTELEHLLLKEASETILSNYLNSFPKGLYHQQVRALLEKQ
ncbi:MAG: hypothetical protein AB8G11_19330 [Saprospiraceae bacterium]